MSTQDIQKLSDSISPNEVKILELFNKIVNESLDTQPRYQRKLVWKKQHKYAFIDTILKNFPFPEVYLASSEMDVENLMSKEVVVDGQQRLTAIVHYIKGEGDFEKQNHVTPFNNLKPDEKKAFLNYKVSVRDLEDISEPLIKEIFKRINNTEYSLNVVERNNAQYGDGEISIFCKQLIELEFEVTENSTDTIIEPGLRTKIFNFFHSNEVFNDNDKKRMYDFQYIMLLCSTILEKDYFSRSTKVEVYLEDYNSEFPKATEVLQNLEKAIDIMSALGFSKRSYWFNKANLFTLLVEFSKVNDVKKLDLTKLERQLLHLEDKVDIYFTADKEEEINLIPDDEKKYFEVARHGSHEKAARDHRAKVIHEIIKSSIAHDQEPVEELVTKNIAYLEANAIKFATIIPTETGLAKSIMDAVTGVRSFLSQEGLHNYDQQEFGPTHKVKQNFFYLKESKHKVKSEMSLYRSNGRGDFRIWFSALSDHATAEDVLALVVKDSDLLLLNLTKSDYTSGF